jgi:hypothetical protein
MAWFQGASDRLVVRTNDIEANFRGSPEYRGKRSGEIIFMDAREIESSVEEGMLNIYEAIVESKRAPDRIRL